MQSNEYPEYLQPGPAVDSGHPAVTSFAARVTSGLAMSPEKAMALYHAVRDGIRYDPYAIDPTVEGMRASTTLRTGRGWCVTKAILLAASCRALEIPARLGFADVRNHLSTQRMRRLMQTDVFYWHGYTEIRLRDRWVKATPAFNLELCERFGLKTLDFDGVHDSVYHPFDLTGRRHMEYLRDRGQFAEPPIEAMIETFLERYPHAESWPSRAGDFEREVEKETQS